MKRKIILSLYIIITLFSFNIIQVDVKALPPTDCVWSCYLNGPCPGTHPLLGNVKCEMYTIGSTNCSISAFNVYVDANYIKNYCQYWQ